MQESLLLQTFKCLSRSDRRALRQFVRSPFHNTREDVVKLYDYLDDLLDAPQRDMRKETIFDMLFNDTSAKSKTAFDVKKLNYTLSFLDKIIREYLIINQLQNEPMECDWLLQKAFVKRGEFKLAAKTLANARQNYDNQKQYNGNAYYQDFRLHHAAYDFNSRLERSDDTSLQEAADALTAFSVAEVLRQGCSMMTQKAFSKKTYQLPLLDISIQIAQSLLEKNGAIPDKWIAIRAYFHAYQSQAIEDDIDTQHFHFQQLRQILEAHWQYFPAAEMHGLYVMAINFCIKKMNSGEHAYEQEVFDIYKIGLANKLLLENNQLTPYTYKNTMMAALKVGEMAWAHTFLDEYKPFLPPQDRNMIYHYNKALYFFRTNDYTAAMPLLQSLNLKDVLFNLDARRLLARIYFELNEINPLLSLIESSKVYLHRQKGIQYHGEMYLNFFKILEQLLKIEPKQRKNKQKEVEILRGIIQDTKYLAERAWLLEKLA